MNERAGPRSAPGARSGSRPTAVGHASEDAIAEDGSMAGSLLELGAATLGESGGHPLPPRLRAAWHGATLAGPAVPVQCTPGDNLAIHVAVTCAPRGSVLVVDVGDVAARGYWGEVLTTAALARGLAGLVIDGGVRDVAALEARHFPVFATTIALRGATKRSRGTVGRRIEVAGVAVSHRDWVVGDADGVVVVPREAVVDVVDEARARAGKETGYFRELEAGSSTVALLGLDVSPVVVDDALGQDRPRSR